ncbi:MAG TPA: zinc-binding dehydrogenase [Bacteroidia bacterium]|jgi:NADPH:quinone reductase-like Zn-dependent oxidoreductase|nr:zinc-binding dehydrogenase [Bacteroidia bacterium]
MKAIFLVKKGDANKAFEFREIPNPIPAEDEVLIKVEYTGLNFADTLARRGLYRDAPPIPCVLGYDVSGVIAAVGSKVVNLKPGDRVTSFTHFGGYAEYAVTKEIGAVKIPDILDGSVATALATQFVTAYYCSAEATNLHEGDTVLIHAAAGGVGTAFVQYALYKKCIVFATAGSDEKVSMLKQAGVQYAINYRKENYLEIIKQNTKSKGIDVIFESLGGKYVKEGIKLLNPGGRIICIGAAEMSNSTNPLYQLKTGLAFGFYHPGQFIMASKSIIGVNMLKISDDKPLVLKRCLEGVMELYSKGAFKPFVGKIFPASEIGKAHEYIESRASTGKTVIKW